MYTHAGILAMLPLKDVANNYRIVEDLLNRIEKDNLVVDKADFEELKRWEQDIKTFFINLAEQLGMTNVHRNTMEQS